MTTFNASITAFTPALALQIASARPNRKVQPSAALPLSSTRAIWSCTIWNDPSGSISASVCRLAPMVEGSANSP